MNIVNKLTIRHLKQNKRRTLVTIIGVIISVAMVTAVATLGTSFLDLMKKQTIASGGEWHVLYKGVNKEQLEAVKADEATKALIISRNVGYSMLEGSQNDSKPYLFIQDYNQQGFQQFPLELTEGRLPQAANEIIIPEHIAANAKVDYGIGDTLKLDVGTRSWINEEGENVLLGQSEPLRRMNDNISETLEVTANKSYTIVGVIKRPEWEPAWSPGYTILSYVDESLIKADELVNATVVLKKVKGSLYAHAKELAKANNIDVESIAYNNDLLRYYGITNNDGLQRTLFSLSAIIMGVIIVGSVSLIYNAFAISVSERSRHLGMLSSVGATRRQKRNSVFFEGAVIGLISIPIGFLCGLVGIGITFYFINKIIEGALGVTEKLSVTITPMSIVISCAISILTIFISTYLPAIRASKVSAIDAIRQSTDVKLTGKAVKTSKLVRKIFGIEAEIGLKNLKRNKRRYQATVFSLVISIVLFLAVSYFTDNLKKSLELSQSGINYDIQVTLGDEKSADQVKNSIAALEDVTEFSALKALDLNAWVNEDVIADELRKSDKDGDSLYKDGKYKYYISVSVLNDQSLKAYAAKAGADYQSLIDPNHLRAIVVDTINYEDEAAGKYAETKAIYAKVGDSLDLLQFDWDTEIETPLNQVEIAALTDQVPMGVYSTGLGGLNIIISEEALDRLFPNTVTISPNNMNTQTRIYLKSADPMATQQQIEEMKESNIYIHNMYQIRQQDGQMILLMSVFTYGFILLITAISIANIFNTTSTSISLRKREFAMLKSVGMTSKGFNKMINYESIFYGVKSLLYGLPISVIVMYFIHKALMNSFSYSFVLPWMSMIYVVIAVFIIVISAMLYSSSKVKKENIIDALKQDSI
ncbi:MAG: FtsX-like permease family protein [Candidatus Pristimantibacillus sp.]